MRLSLSTCEAGESVSSNTISLKRACLVENSVIAQNRVVQSDALLVAKNGLQSFFTVHARCLCHRRSSESYKVFRFESSPAAC